jgi:hypothetical protein
MRSINSSMVDQDDAVPEPVAGTTSGATGRDTGRTIVVG